MWFCGSGVIIKGTGGNIGGLEIDLGVGVEGWYYRCKGVKLLM